MITNSGNGFLIVDNENKFKVSYSIDVTQHYKTFEGKNYPTRETLKIKFELENHSRDFSGVIPVLQRAPTFIELDNGVRVKIIITEVKQRNFGKEGTFKAKLAPGVSIDDLALLK